MGEILFEFGFHTLAEPFRDRERRNPLFAAAGVAVMGALGGLLSVALLPDRMLGVTGVPGLSLLLAPALNALAMEGLGTLLEQRRGKRPYIATYWAGATFAFSMALVRFLVIAP